jgi:hypothetical protein
VALALLLRTGYDYFAGLPIDELQKISTEVAELNGK